MAIHLILLSFKIASYFIQSWHNFPSSQQFIIQAQVWIRTTDRKDFHMDGAFTKIIIDQLPVPIASAVNLTVYK
jgi:hypothetical protein